MNKKAQYKIPWWLYLIIGAIVTGGSLFYPEDLLIFTIVGIIFLIVAVIKIIFIMINKPKKQARIHQTHKHTLHKIQNKQERFPQQVHHQTSNCPNCKHLIHANQNFCHNCGYRLR